MTKRNAPSCARALNKGKRGRASKWPVIVRSKIGAGALQISAANDYTEVMQELSEHGADMGLKDKDGLSALAWASKGHHTEATNLLRNTGTSKSKDANKSEERTPSN